MLKNLSQKQLDLLPVYRDKWIKIGLSTEPINYEEAKKAANLCYELAGLALPETFYKVGSPLEACKLASKLADIDNLSALSQQVCGCQDAGWLSSYDFYLNETSLTGLDSVRGLLELAHHCGWWSPYDTAVILQDRPCKIKRDENNRLHCEDGKAIEYRDGFGIYYWHGVDVPGDWIEKPETLTAQEALQQSNLELRRVACEIVTWDVILKELDVSIIETDEDLTIGQLIEVSTPDIGREKFLRATCGTGRSFAIPVPPEMTTALEANAWTYNLQPWEYNPEIRT